MIKEKIMETKNEKFTRLANARLVNILEQLRILNNLSNTSNYDYDETQISELFKIMEKNVRSSKRLFAEGLEKLTIKKAEGK